ncbi:MAG: hypothetical protein IPP98_06145 [Gemmatimonadetes bacterium]|nr:hypothetical protein [Gemmatimonadota bacterium]
MLSSLLVILPQVIVKTPRDLDALAMRTYIAGAVTGGLFLLLAVVIAHSIKFEGGSRPKDPGKRRLSYWLLLFAMLATFFGYNAFAVASGVSTNLQAKFMTINATGCAIALLTYLVVGFVLTKVFSTGKLANWFSAGR